MNISVVIPTYKEPEALDLCLRSAIEGQKNKNEIIVVVDGFFEMNRSVIEKYKSDISVLDIGENVGMIRAMNLGHYNASNDLVFHVQDDNVFPFNWDVCLEKDYEPNSVLTPNQIEPIPSMFQQFDIKDLGRDPSTFDLQAFWDYVPKNIGKLGKFNDETGSTFPFLINKQDYLKIGGLDETYPGPWVVDWEFFMKCKMNGMKMLRSYSSQFYHFVSLGTRTPDQVNINSIKEEACHDYFRYKWGNFAKHNPLDNSKSF